MLSPQASIKVLEEFYTQNKIAKMSGISQPTISRISSGKHRTTMLDTAIALDELARKAIANTDLQRL